MAIYYQNQMRDYYYGGNFFGSSTKTGLIYYGNVQVNPGDLGIAYEWAITAGITNADVVTAVDTFVGTLQTANIWNKMVAIYPMITDSDVSSIAKTQFTYNLVNPNTYTATYLNNLSTGSKSGLTNGGSDTFITITSSDIGNNYMMGFYTDSDASSTNQIDMGGYESGTKNQYIVAGRNKVGSIAQIVLTADANPGGFPTYDNTIGSGPFTGLFSVGGIDLDGINKIEYAYRRGTLLGSQPGYNYLNRSNDYKIGLGSYLQTNTTANNPTTKTYQFCYFSTGLNSTEINNLATAVNNLQGDIDAIFSTSRKAY